MRRSPAAEPTVRPAGTDRFTVDNLHPSDYLAAVRPTLTVDLSGDTPRVIDRYGAEKPVTSVDYAKAVDAVRRYRRLYARWSGKASA